MARAIGWLALIVAYVATLFYLAAMVTPWWYTKYYPVGSTEDAWYDANPGIDQHTGLFRMTNCFIDGSCITGGQIYKNNSSLQWVYTAVLVLMILGWVPWLIFVHLLHFRNSKNAYRANHRGLRPLMLLTALATWLFILAAFIVFAAGIVKTNGTYNSGGLYGHKGLLSQNGLVGTGRNVDEAYENINKRSASMMIKRQSGGSGGTNIVIPSGVTPTTGPSAGTGSVSASASATSEDTGITAPLGESGSESDTGSASASASPSASASGSPSASGFATGSSDSDYASSSAAVPATSAGNGNNQEDSNTTFGYSGPEDARNLNLYWEPHAWGTLPYGNQGYTLLGAGIPVLDESITVGDLNGPVAYKYGANAAWYFALLALAVIPLALILGLCIAPAKAVATSTTATSVTSQAAYVPPMYPARTVV